MKQLGRFTITSHFDGYAERYDVVFNAFNVTNLIILSSPHCFSSSKLALEAGERALRELIAAGNESLKEVGE